MQKSGIAAVAAAAAAAAAAATRARGRLLLSPLKARARARVFTSVGQRRRSSKTHIRMSARSPRRPPTTIATLFGLFDAYDRNEARARAPIAACCAHARLDTMRRSPPFMCVACFAVASLTCARRRLCGAGECKSQLLVALEKSPDWPSATIHILLMGIFFVSSLDVKCDRLHNLNRAALEIGSRRSPTALGCLRCFLPTSTLQYF